MKIFGVLLIFIILCCILELGEFICVYQLFFRSEIIKKSNQIDMNFHMNLFFYNKITGEME